MEIPSSLMSGLMGRLARVEESIASIRDATEPVSPPPVEATLDSINLESDEFVSISSAVPVSICVDASVNFDGEIGLEIKIAGEWRVFPIPIPGTMLLDPDRGMVHQYVPRGAAVRVFVEGVTEGEVEILIFQGELPEAE
jgi:hypothetical protein